MLFIISVPLIYCFLVNVFNTCFFCNAFYYWKYLIHSFLKINQLNSHIIAVFPEFLHWYIFLTNFFMNDYAKIFKDEKVGIFILLEFSKKGLREIRWDIYFWLLWSGNKLILRGSVLTYFLWMFCGSFSLLIYQLANLLVKSRKYLALI